ncbi:glycoside hydrolase family 3 N-terminal domain-containing protein [Sphingomonas sp.]|uniref:glycoside hydrolase family 3 N-terminal domain-containing protein n=1 Tax=Sphingomonas sp. TaxID=28214 RepID=UPI002E360FD0|nr:glycoside hydrolase family 3 N-terminal domain-containing protein [Sphingomonas sp.]HEX4695621.1 glycoside hydrolase family 3 N-terminal domain-containing protein [Sphingomonas sp.]
MVSATLPALAKAVPATDPFIDRLIRTMSVQEKAGQLSIYSDPARTDGPGVNPGLVAQSMDELKSRIARGEMTGLFNGIGTVAGRELQKVAIEQSPHKIPLIFAGDVIHGMKTAFPVPLGEAASFDPSLAQRTARAAAVEASAKGIMWTFAPMVDIARDERWGRVVEGSGEDTWLGVQFAAARVRGFQGGSLKDETSMLACPKHFAAYGAVQGGMEYNTADIADMTLREVHLPPFKAAFDAGALSTMSSFNDIAGVPSTGNHYLLTDILRGEWGFKGLVVSDYTSEEELILHGYAADGPDAVVKALTAGCDISMQSRLYWKHLPDLVKSGRVPIAVVDTAVRRVLRVKQALGLFDNPYRSLDPTREARDMRRPEAIALAREAGRKSMVLLKNDGGLLPLAKKGRIALIGPAVSQKSDYPGPWASFPDIESCVTVEQGFRAALGNNAKLGVTRGSDYEAPIDGEIDRAVKLARDADVIVLMLGESAGMSGEAQARTDIGIPAPQMALAEAVAATGKPIVVLLRHGRALALSGAVRNASAIVATWFLGSETGNSVADVVFGDYAPQGRLPVSFPQVSGQEPFYYNHRRTGRPQLTADGNYKARYREVTDEPLYAFGYGLTYSSVSYSATAVSAGTIPMSGSVTVTATVTNTGQRRCHEVAQLYVNDKVASLTQPVRSLKGIKHLDLDPGRSATVSFTLSRDDLGFVHPDKRRYPEPGAFDVWIAPSAVGGTPATFVLGAGA